MITPEEVLQILEDRTRQQKQGEVLKQLKAELDAMTQTYIGEAFDHNKIKADIRMFLEGHHLGLPTPHYDILIGVDPAYGSARIVVQFHIDDPA